MANPGDAAAAEGLHVYTGNELAQQLWIRDNERGDEIAGRARKTHTHKSVDITDASTISSANKLVKFNAQGVFSTNPPINPLNAATKAYADAHRTELLDLLTALAARVTDLEGKQSDGQ